jgi:hypothetical protein
MAITNIKRDWGDCVTIVRILSTDTLGVVGATDYILNQAANIDAINNGAFTWLPSDEVLVSAADGNAFFQISADFNSLIANVNTNATYLGLTALAGGGQTGATQLNPGVNQFTTVVTTGDSAILPADVQGNTVIVVNASSNSMNVFPASGDTINALSANTALAVAAGATTIFFGVTASNWHSK